MAQWLLADYHISEALASGLEGLLRHLVANGYIKGVLIEGLSKSGEWLELCAVGLSGFIRPDLMDHYVSQPRGFVYLDILESAAARQTPLLTLPQIATANSGAGLDMVVHYMQRGWNLADEKWHAVGVLGHRTYVFHHRGYNLRRVMQEDWTANREIYKSAGYEELATVAVDAASLPKGATFLSPTRSVFFAQRTDVAARAPGSTISHVFDYRPPNFFFSVPEQKLLTFALTGSTDQELASDLNLPLSSVKNTWRSIYQKVEHILPFVLGVDGGDDGKRGPEKRRRVLSYVEEHPQELRPHEAGK